MKPLVTQSLPTAWILTEANRPDDPVPATVPGCVHTDLLAEGRVPDPWFRDNEKELAWVAEKDWVYTATLQVSDEMLARSHQVLRFEGLDTLCRVEWNGESVGQADNMFRTWEFDIQGLVRPGENELRLTFFSPLPVMKKKDAERRLYSWNVFHEDYSGKSYVRKMGCAFGWDWGLMAPTAGIWRPAALVAWDARLKHVRVRQEHQEGRVLLHLSSETDGEGTVRHRLDFEGETICETEGNVLEVSEPRLWWPNGLGERPRYTLASELLAEDGSVLDSRKIRLGLRELSLVREKDEHGESFRFRVNGVDFFAKGGNWIPCDVFPSRVGNETYRHLLRACADSHMNMIRVWGGGIYEDERFYDLCDELGLLVWQDFMFACSAYPADDPGFMENVRSEALDQVRRLHHRACLALWCGNNELEQGLVEWGRVEWEDGKPMPEAPYKDLFDDLLPGVVALEDGSTPYWPSSGHTPGAGRANCHDDRSGDAHSWSVWFGNQPIEAQRGWKFRFMSEFGFQSYPEPRSVQSFTLPEDRGLINWIMDYHQRSGPGNQTIYKYLLSWFPVPKDFESSLWMTQLIQAICIQVAAEHARRIQGRMDGLLYWQINDLWPGATWSSIDVYGRWKALQHFSRRFFSPVCVSLLESHSASTMSLHVSNHRRGSLQASLEWRVTTLAGETLEEGSEDIEVPPQSDREIRSLDCTGHRFRKGRVLLPLEVRGYPGAPVAGDRDLVVWARVVENGSELSRNLGFFAKPKYWDLPDPRVEFEVGGDGEGTWARFSSASFSPWTRIEVPGRDVAFGDNFFHIGPGFSHRVPIPGISADELARGLRVVPLRENF